MQKLFEDWRGYLNEITGQETSSDLAALSGLGSKTAEAELDFRLSDPEYRRQQEIVTTIFSIIDPSGITGWPDFVVAAADFNKKPSLASAGWFILAFAGVMPVVGGAGRAITAPGKIKKLSTLSGKIVPRLSKYNSVITGAKEVVKRSMAARGLKKAFESGVVDAQKFAEWYTKNINSKATRQEIGEAWSTVNKYVGKIEATDDFALYRAVDGQFKNIIKKFNVRVDPDRGEGGWMMSLAATAPKVWDEFITNINKIDSIPTVAANVAVGTKTAEKGGKALVRAMMHEIGHVQLLKNFPRIGKVFLKEYHNLILKRISQMRKGLSADDLDDAKELLNAAKAAVSGADPHYIDTAVDQIKIYDKAEIKTVLRAVQVLVLEESSKSLRFAAQQGGDIRKAMIAGQKQYNYSLFGEAMKQINSRLGIKTNKFYFLQAEEVFAELFEKSVRKRVGGGALASTNFPGTSKVLEFIIDKEIKSLLESKLKLKHKLLISTRTV